MKIFKPVGKIRRFFLRFFGYVGITIICLLILLAIWFPIKASMYKPESISFDAHWSFKKDKNIDAKAANLNHANWRKLDVPHDWSIEDLPQNATDTIISPFPKKAIGKNATAFTEGV